MSPTFDVEAEFCPFDCAWTFGWSGDTLARCFLEALPRELGRPLADWERERVAEGHAAGAAERDAERAKPRGEPADASEYPY